MRNHRLLFCDYPAQSSTLQIWKLVDGEVPRVERPAQRTMVLIEDQTVEEKIRDHGLIEQRPNPHFDEPVFPPGFQAALDA